MLRYEAPPTRADRLGVLWEFFCRGPEVCGGPAFIEARWGPLAGEEVKDQVQALIESWSWRQERANSGDSSD